uniref:Uncharacterized protein n=1 Tax=Timema bartmani TaxID=61472 RepID=A0A7R9I7F3_9NEOP|nr:unnamed protein product [Timema bartmani]
MDAWRQVMEVLCAVTPPDIFPVDPRMILLLEIIHVLLKKVVTVDNVAAELAVKCSGMVMIMMVNLRHSLVLKTKQERMHKDVPEHQLEIDSRKKCDLKSENNMSTLRIILSNIIKWILSSSVSSQKLRANLYGALLNYLHIMFRGGLLDKPQAGPNDNTSVNCLDSSRHHISLTKINSDQRVPTMEILVSAGECLLQFLCLDCIGGHNIFSTHENSSFYWLTCQPLSLMSSCANGKLPFLPLDKARQQWKVFNTVVPRSEASRRVATQPGCPTCLKELLNCLMLQRSNIVLTLSLPTITLPPTPTHVVGTITLPLTATHVVETITLPLTATHVVGTITLPPTATHAAGASTLPPHLRTSLCSTATNVAGTVSPTLFLPLPTRV